MSKKITEKNFELVLDNFKAQLILLRDSKEKNTLKSLCKDINNFFDELLSQDAFGTEGQLDPRGDQRN